MPLPGVRITLEASVQMRISYPSARLMWHRSQDHRRLDVVGLILNKSGRSFACSGSTCHQDPSSVLVVVKPHSSKSGPDVIVPSVVSSYALQNVTFFVTRETGRLDQEVALDDVVESCSVIDGVLAHVLKVDDVLSSCGSSGSHGFRAD